jgi:hypothetical protein
MSLRYKYKQAGRIIDRLSPDDLKSARQIAVEVQKAQQNLLKQAEGNFDRCVSVCKGLCCRNVALDPIISVWDFVYILILDRSIGADIEACLSKETPFFTSDCVFLLNGRGPCLFPLDQRPEICITTFCTDVKAVEKEIQIVKLKFFKFYISMTLARVKALLKSIFNWPRKGTARAG